jgi:hypothetical protein
MEGANNRNPPGNFAALKAAGQKRRASSPIPLEIIPSDDEDAPDPLANVVAIDDEDSLTFRLPFKYDGHPFDDALEVFYDALLKG